MLVREGGGRCPNKSGGGEVVGNFFWKNKWAERLFGTEEYVLFLVWELK